MPTNIETAKSAKRLTKLERELEDLIQYALTVIDLERQLQNNTLKKPQFTKQLKKLTIDIHNKLFP